jgi:hypothetical protein
MQGTWVLLLQDASYGGKWQSEAGYAPLVYGTFSAFKAVYKRGYTTCQYDLRSEYHWNECKSHYVGHEYNFELKKNGAYVVESTVRQIYGFDIGDLHPDCRVPTTPTGDIVCMISLTLEPGDKLTPTWFEASHGVTISDNDGTIFIDLYGYRQVCIMSYCFCFGL